MSFKKRYRDLEMEVYSALRTIIEQSDYSPENYSQQAIQVEVENYTELAIINDRLVFLDGNGHQYDIFVVSLEELIEIYEKYLGI